MLYRFAAAIGGAQVVREIVLRRREFMLESSGRVVSTRTMIYETVSG